MSQIPANLANRAGIAAIGSNQPGELGVPGTQPNDRVGRHSLNPAIRNRELLWFVDLKSTNAGTLPRTPYMDNEAIGPGGKHMATANCSRAPSSCLRPLGRPVRRKPRRINCCSARPFITADVTGVSRDRSSQTQENCSPEASRLAGTNPAGSQLPGCR